MDTDESQALVAAGFSLREDEPTILSFQWIVRIMVLTRARAEARGYEVGKDVWGHPG